MNAWNTPSTFAFPGSSTRMLHLTCTGYSPASTPVLNTAEYTRWLACSSGVLYGTRTPYVFSLIHVAVTRGLRSEEHTSELQSLMRISYAVFCLKKKKQIHNKDTI